MITLEEIWARILIKEEEDKKKRLEVQKRKIEEAKTKQTNNEETVSIDPEVYYSEENMADNQVGRIKPFRITEYTVPGFIIPTSDAKGFKGSQRKQFSKILTFIKHTQRKRFNDCCTALPIPTNSKMNLAIWGNHVAVLRALKLMETIGLIEVLNPNFRKSNYESYSKTYKYYVENEIKFLEYCLENNIEKFDIIKKEEDELEEEIEYIVDEETGEVIEINSDDITSEDIEKIRKVVGDGILPDPKEVKFGNNLHFVKPDNLTRKQFEKYLRSCLYKNYPYFIELLKVIRKLNKEYYEDKYPEFYIRFKVKITWGKKGKRTDKSNVVVGISIRETNDSANTETSKRPALRDKYGLTYDYDVKSSVPRLTYFLNTGQWLESKKDFYTMIHDEMYPDTECTPQRREAIKRLHMRAYFDDKGKDSLGGNTCYAMYMKGAKRSEVYDEMWRLRQAVVKVEGGKTYGNEIFYVESWVYLMVLNDLLTKENQLVWMVYDCFYGKNLGSDKIVNIGIDNMIRAHFEVYLREWKKLNVEKVEVMERDIKIYNLLNEIMEVLKKESF